jgi:hypothetical protein
MKITATHPSIHLSLELTTQEALILTKIFNNLGGCEPGSGSGRPTTKALVDALGETLGDLWDPDNTLYAKYHSMSIGSNTWIDKL